MAEEPKTVDIKDMLHFKTGNIALPVLETILNTIPFELGFVTRMMNFNGSLIMDIGSTNGLKRPLVKTF